MKALLRPALLLVVSSAARVATAGEPPWELRDTVEGIAVYNRDLPGSPVKEVKAEGTIDAPPAAVWAVLHDIPAYPRTMPYTKVTAILGHENDPNAAGGILYYYTALAFPIVSDRDYTLRVSIDHVPADGSGLYKLSWRAANGYPKAPPPLAHYVRLSDVSGYWQLSPEKGGAATRFVYFVHTNPESSLPGFLVNKANSDVIPKVVDALREWAKKPPYAAAK